jgi:hypothetical protein
MKILFRAGVLVCLGSVAGPAQAADLPMGVQTAARCAVRAATTAPPLDTIRIVGAQDSTPHRTLYSARDLLIVGAGTRRGLGLGQQFIIRRATSFGHHATAGPRAVGTAGWLRIVAANETTAIGQVEFACDSIEQGDYLEPFTAPAFPDNLDRVDTTGELDFAAPAHVLFGDKERVTAGVREFVVIDVGLGRGAEPGARFAIYRDLQLAGMPLAPVGEAVVMQADADTAVVRLTATHDVVRQGDLMIPRKSR